MSKAALSDAGAAQALKVLGVAKKDRPEAPVNKNPNWITAAEAALLIGVKPTSIYGYADCDHVKSKTIYGLEHFSRTDCEKYKVIRDARRAGQKTKSAPVKRAAMERREPKATKVAVASMDGFIEWVRVGKALGYFKAYETLRQEVA